MQPLISICIPIYNGEKYIEETLKAIYNQTYGNLEILISIDLSTDNTFNICNNLKQLNTIIYTQNERLGWVKNCNFLINKSSGKYFSIIPHDDLIPPDYFEKLINNMINNPNIVNCYPYIEAFGKMNTKIYQPNITGNLDNRIEEFIRNHYNGVSFRGLIRKDLPHKYLYLNENQHLDMMADTIFILQHAIVGELHSVDVKYFKRYHDSNEHATWHGKQPSDIAEMWSTQCATIYNMVQHLVSDKQKIYNLCKQRLSKRYGTYIGIVDLFDKKIIRNVCVMGAGIQGCCCALMLKKCGYNVSIIDKECDIMTQASANQEGKIHMGFVYSNDSTFKTGMKIMNDALHFSYQMENLLEMKIDWNEIKSTKFLYLVPGTSLVSEEQLDVYFGKLQELYTELLSSNPHLSYLGEKPLKIFQKRYIPDNLNKNFFKCCYETEEYAISQNTLKKYIDIKLRKCIDLILNERIESVEHGDHKFKVITDKQVREFDLIVNCLWEGKKKFDNILGMDYQNDNNYRFKFGIVSEYIDCIKNTQSMTIVNGPFGDFVNFPNQSDKKMYFSWYPVSMYQMVTDWKQIPNDWVTLTNSDINHELHANLKQQHLNKFRELFCQDFTFINENIVGGIIVASGHDDIGNAKSELHERSTNPVMKKGNYYAVSTGKFTSAPYNVYLLNSMMI